VHAEEVENATYFEVKSGESFCQKNKEKSGESHAT
jgi:hypothetical protein